MGTENSTGAPVDEGEIIFADADRGMLNTRSGMALNFTRDQCAGFDPAAGNVVGIGRIEGMQAYGLSLLSEAAAPMFSTPSVDESKLDELTREAARDPRPAAVSVAELRDQIPAHDWEEVFTEIDRKEPGLSLEALVDALTELQCPFDRAEVAEILQFDPSAESLVNPLVRLKNRWPRSWLSFLHWSNGGDFTNGDRYFQHMFSVAEVREYIALYGIIQSLPGAIPFAMNGGAALYLFDTRSAPADGEYPVVFCHCSEVADGWDNVIRLEDSFVACCMADSDPEDLN